MNNNINNDIDLKTLGKKLEKSLTLLVTSKKNFEKQEKEMLEHMRNKYGIQLQVDWSDRTVYAHSYNSWNCSIEGTTDKSQQGKIEVIRWRNKKSDPFEDNYYPILISSEIEKRVNNVFKEHFNEYKLYVRPEREFIDNKFNSISQLSQYLLEKKSKHACYYVVIHFPDKENNNYEETEQKVSELLKNADIDDCNYVIFWSNRQTYNTITYENSSHINMKNLYNKRIKNTIYK